MLHSERQERVFLVSFSQTANAVVGWYCWIVASRSSAAVPLDENPYAPPHTELHSAAPPSTGGRKESDASVFVPLLGAAIGMVVLSPFLRVGGSPALSLGAGIGAIAAMFLATLVSSLRRNQRSSPEQDRAHSEAVPGQPTSEPPVGE